MRTVHFGQFEVGRLLGHGGLRGVGDRPGGGRRGGSDHTLTTAPDKILDVAFSTEPPGGTVRKAARRGRRDRPTGAAATLAESASGGPRRMLLVLLGLLS
ncbi:hypothetical protein GCM10027614_19250 [Micromonospora vulcania]